MNIEYAYLMTDKDLHDYYNHIRSIYNNRRIDSIQKLETHGERLIEEYENYEQVCIQNFYAEKKRLADQIAQYKGRKCLICGSTLKFIIHEWGNFYGCPNYRDGREHTKFSVIQEQSNRERFDNLRVRVDMNWLTNILKLLSLNRQIRASELLDFYDFNGLEDLREKYGYKNTKDRIYGYHGASVKAKREEKEIEAFMNSFFEKIDVQRGIRYKLESEKEKVLIIDMILPYKDIIYLIEIKRNVHDIRVDQLQLYYNILFYIVSKHDSRTIRPLFLVYNTPEYSPYYVPSNFTLFEHIRPAKNVFQIVSALEQGAIFFEQSS